MPFGNGLLTICEHLDGVRYGFDIQIGEVVYEGSDEMICQKHNKV